jgi:hypothetical protein
VKEKIEFRRPVKNVPCDCSDGPCGWAHWAHSGPSEYTIDGEPATKEQVEALIYGGGNG